jgi:hypothetical protein
MTNLASHRHWVQRAQANWPAFLQKRLDRLAQQDRNGVAAEKVAENILEDFFTTILDWSICDLNYQIGFADLVLTRLGIKYLLVEAKRPGSLAWNRPAVEQALDQARRYADEQHVKVIAVSDGSILYAADIQHGGLRDRVFASLEVSQPCDSLWLLSREGIYRPCPQEPIAAVAALPDTPDGAQPVPPAVATDQLLHPKYHIPAHCFAYVGDANRPATWKLPYCLADGHVDLKRLPKAIQAILSNYRGETVKKIPEAAIPDVLVRLAQAAARIGRMPRQCGDGADAYDQLARALEQTGRLGEIQNPNP